MSDVIYKLYGSVSGALGNSIASLDIQNDGFIEGVLMNLWGTGMDALNDIVQLEVSFGSQQSFTQNDIRASIAHIVLIQQFLTSGGGAQANTAFMSFQKGIPISAGERIHMHGNASAGTVMAGNAYLYTVTTNSNRVARRNR